MKKIVILGTAYPFRGGMAAFNERLANAFLEVGDDVNIENFTLQYPGFLFPGKTQYANWDAPKGVEIKSTVNSVNPFNWIKIGRKLKKQKPDILIIGYWMPFMAPCFGTIAKIVKSNKHTKIIGLLHNIYPHEKLPGSKILPNYFVSNTDAFVSLSKSVLNDLDTFDTIKPRTFCPHPLYDHYGDKISRSIALDNLKLSDEYRYILFFGLIRDYKGLDLLIDAFADKRFEKNKIRLIIAGEFYTDSSKYLKQIEDLNLKSSIVLHDRFIPDPEVGNYFGAADIIAQPYKTATQSGVTQIGYHFEKPMLVTNVGGLAEIIPNEKVGYVVEPNPKEIANKLINFFENNRSNEFTKNVIIEKRKYSWDTMTNAFSGLFDELQKDEDN